MCSEVEGLSFFGNIALLPNISLDGMLSLFSFIKFSAVASVLLLDSLASNLQSYFHLKETNFSPFSRFQIASSLCFLSHQLWAAIIVTTIQ